MHKVLGFQSRHDSNTLTLNQMASMENHGPWTPHEHHMNMLHHFKQLLCKIQENVEAVGTSELT